MRSLEIELTRELNSEIFSDLESFDWDTELDQYTEKLRLKKLNELKSSSRIRKILGNSVNFSLYYDVFFIGAISFLIAGLFSPDNILGGFFLSFFFMHLFTSSKVLLVGVHDFFFYRSYKDFKYELSFLDVHEFWKKTLNKRFSSMQQSLIARVSNFKNERTQVSRIRREASESSYPNKKLIESLVDKESELHKAEREVHSAILALDDIKHTAYEKLDELHELVTYYDSLDDREETWDSISKQAQAVLDNADESLFQWETHKQRVEKEIKEVLSGLQQQVVFQKDLIEATKEVQRISHERV